MSHERDCYELAVKVLADFYDPIAITRAQELAEVIQNCIDMYFYNEGLTDAAKEKL